MTAVTITTRLGPRVEPTIPPFVHRRPRCRRASAATYWRRRAAAAALALAVVVVAGQAGSALGGSPLAAPERRPADAPVTYVVQPGDSLWSIARRLEPGADPRPVVDALAEERGRTDVVPGETIVWTP